MIKQIIHSTVKVIDEILTETKTWKEFFIIASLIGIFVATGLLSVILYVVVNDRAMLYEMFANRPRLQQRIDSVNIEEILDRRLDSTPDIENYSIIIYFFDKRSIQVHTSVGVDYGIRDRLIIEDSPVHSAHITNSCITMESLAIEDLYRTSCPIYSTEYGLEGYVIAVFRNGVIPNETQIQNVTTFLREIVLLLS